MNMVEFALLCVVQQDHEGKTMRGMKSYWRSIVWMTLHLVSGIVLFLGVCVPAVLLNFTLNAATNFGMQGPSLEVLQHLEMIVVLLDACLVLVFLGLSMYWLLREIFHE
jgi:hypothetical protein